MKKLFACLLFCLLTSTVQASVIYDWVCDDAASCSDSGGGVFGGYITFDDAAVANGATFTDGTGKIDSFFFEVTFGSFQATGPWFLSGLVASNPLSNLTWTFSNDGSHLTNLGTVNGATQCVGQSPFDICFADSVSGNHALNINEFEVEDVGNLTRSGQWVRRASASVPEPSALALLGLGLAGIGLTRRKKTA